MLDSGEEIDSMGTEHVDSVMGMFTREIMWTGNVRGKEDAILRMGICM